MKRVGLLSLVIGFCMLMPHVLQGQSADAPAYKDGDWWKVKVEVAYYPGWPKEGRCYEFYPEYVVKIEQGKPKVYGAKEDGQEETDCSVIISRLLAGELRESARRLNFPLSIGKTWRDRVLRRTHSGSRWVEEETKVVSYEKVKTPKEELFTFHIERTVYWQTINTEAYFYSPKAKANVLFTFKGERIEVRVTLVDFNVGQ